MDCTIDCRDKLMTQHPDWNCYQLYWELSTYLYYFATFCCRFLCWMRPLLT
jgi:hypothetical protein